MNVAAPRAPRPDSPADRIARYRLIAATDSLPPPFLAEVTDWLTRYEAATDLLARLEHEGDRARADLAAAKHSAPERLVAALAAGKVKADHIGSDLADLRVAVDTAEDRYAIATKAAHIVWAGLAGASRGHTRPLLDWVAQARAATPWWEPMPEPVPAVWRLISGRVRADLPPEACQRPKGSEHPYPARVSLILEPTDLTSSSPVPADRYPFAWDAIASGLTYLTEEKDRLIVRVLAPWEARRPLPPQAPTSSPSGRTAVRRRAGFSRQ